jgi:hypothetical protein
VTGTGDRFCLIYRAGADFGLAELDYGDSTDALDMFGVSRTRRNFCEVFETRETRTITVSPEGNDIINIDGYWIGS